MRWSSVYSGEVVHYGTRKYKLSDFEGCGWAMYKGKEYFVQGYAFCSKYGLLASLQHPTENSLTKIVPRAELTIL